ncbi:hypothetical protein BS329_35355 [Amycolatopsis coloradensis]|uniref:Uncharacterized protein n=1 Tax=Amycolatopsis coloradensis TaxID=76021 RepID=A0A1R0KH88_9PSEU|nr:hypothetical protein BS329_35355 [Amycolatopsis coloradensis]
MSAHSPDSVDVLSRAGNDSGAALLVLLLFVLSLPISGDRENGDHRRSVRRRHSQPRKTAHGRALLLEVCVART